MTLPVGSPVRAAGDRGDVAGEQQDGRRAELGPSWPSGGEVPLFGSARLRATFASPADLFGATDADPRLKSGRDQWVGVTFVLG